MYQLAFATVPPSTAPAKTLRSFKATLLGAAVSLSLAQPALAQQPETDQSAEIESIVVTGSRIRANGNRQPTPVTVIGAEELERDAHMDIGAVISALPSAGTATSPNTSQGSQSVSNGSAGLNLVNLRDLGVNRTLVLYDGNRVVQSDRNGGVDLNLLPSALVERIDVVTGGASAAWGSDAVSGVVNVILNKQFSGWAVDLEGARTEEGPRETRKVETSFGTDLFDGKAHLILSGSQLESPDVVQPYQTSWYNSQALIDNPEYTETNGQPRLIPAEPVGLWSMTPGGVITSGPLRGTQFVGPQGTPTPFEFGEISGTLMQGGTFVSASRNGQSHNLAVPIETESYFGYFSYDLTDNIKASIELNYGESDTKNGSASYTRQGNVHIGIDNPYLDPSIAARMASLGIDSFPLGTTNTNNGAVEGNSFARGLGNLHNEVGREMSRQVINLEGTFGDWLWDVGIQHSKVSRNTHMVVNPVVANYNRAVDAVRVTEANVGSSGLSIGSIACRSSLTDPGNGCAPLNILGENVASDAAMAYVNSGDSQSDEIFEQDTAVATIQGRPFSTWAGPAAIVGGIEYRKESMRQTAGPIAYERGYAAGNWQHVDAGYDTTEGFVEVELPLLRDSVVDSLDLNAAGRVTEYSTSGTVETWKVGLTTDINDAVRLRGSASSDIRAPTLHELFNPGSTSIQVVSDPFRPGSNPTNIFALSGGNENLNPEVSKTLTGGIVFTPGWLPGLSASVDYYSIDIDDAIVGTSFPYVLAQCYAGLQVFCPLIQRDANGVIEIIAGAPVNAAAAETSGLDVEASYTTDFLNGRLSLRFMGNYTYDRIFDQLGVVVDMAGSLNRDPPNIGQGLPKLKAVANATYSRDRFSTTLQLRGTGDAKLNNAWGPQDVADNSVPSVTYMDLRANMYLDDQERFQAYIAIDNVLDKDPPIVPHSADAGIPYFYVPTRTDIYDALGRTWRLGVRARF